MTDHSYEQDLFADGLKDENSTGLISQNRL